MCCSCHKAGLDCSTWCGERHGIYGNMPAVEVSDDNDTQILQQGCEIGFDLISLSDLHI